MPLIQSVTTVLTAAVNDNLLSGSQFEYLPYNAFVEFGITGDATNGDDVRLDIYSGQDVLCENASISLLARTPVYPDDFPLNDVAAGGERLKMRVRNVGAGTATVYFAVKITPV